MNDAVVYMYKGLPIDSIHLFAGESGRIDLMAMPAADDNLLNINCASYITNKRKLQSKHHVW
jgi:hypothetical protein